MTATLISSVMVSRRRWLLTASSDEGLPTYRWWLRGELIRTSASTTLEVSTADDDVPFIQVRDDDVPPSQADHPGRIRLYWHSDSRASRFRVEQFIGAAWVVIQRLSDDGRREFNWHSGWMEDAETRRYRVVAEDAGGNDSTVVPDVAVTIVRPPDVPVWSPIRNGDETLTIGATNA